MTGLSILTKTYAIVLAPSHPAGALACWAASIAADVLALREEEAPARKLWTNVIALNVSCIILGLAAHSSMAAAAMRWKDGLPGFAAIAGFILHATKLPVAVFEGDIFLTTMAGPLRFSVSIDNLGLAVPGTAAALAGAILLFKTPSLRDAGRRWLGVVVLLASIALLRFVLSTALFVSLCDFIGYESEELPLGPFVKPGAIAWSYFPFLLAATVFLTRLCGKSTAAGRISSPTAGRRIILTMSAFLLLLAIGLYEPEGKTKQGSVLINTYHTQWSRTDRPYDRDWYGADSGYNYACLKRWFEHFYDVRELKTRLSADALAGASILIIYLPDQPFSDEELHLIHAFVQRGGGLFLIGDHTNVFGSSSHLNAISEPFGFQFRDDVLFDLDQDFFQCVHVPRRHSPFLHGMSFFKFRGPASIKPTSLNTRPILTVPHAKAVRAIYSVNNFYPPPHDHPRMTTGEFWTSAAARFGKGRVVAFADSTIFSNFEIFYPGKYEYLLNVANWLNHSDSVLTALAKRSSLVAALLLIAWMLARYRRPRAWLWILVTAAVAVGTLRWMSLAIERQRAEFPAPVRPLQTLFFAADADDPAYVLRDFISEAPYDQRYDIFIQWVLRTDVFSGFYIAGNEYRHALYEHLAEAAPATTGLALIVNTADKLDDLSTLPAAAGFDRGPLLLMLSSELDWPDVATSIRTAGLVTDDDLQKLKGNWPNGEVALEHEGRRILFVFSCERFSDQHMGFSEKVIPNDAQRARYDEAFALIDRLFQAE